MPDYTLYNRLDKLSRSGKKRFHMPGHKGRSPVKGLEGSYFIDYTETPDTGDLYSNDRDIISEAEDKAARYFGAQSCLFLTCGATQGIKAAIYTFANGKNSLLADRNIHKSVIDACVLLDIFPKYIAPDFDARLGITMGFDLEKLDNMLSDPEISAFIVTSPTYYGYCHDLDAISELCRRHGVKLIVDCAHGSHLKACGLKDPVMSGADAVICSAHKTMPTLTQGAFLLLKDGSFSEKARRGCILFGTTSPSYPIMASLDIGREYIEALSEEQRLLVLSACCDVRKRLADAGFYAPMLGDPLRITINCPSQGYELFDFFMIHDAVPEMCDFNNTVFIVTFSDTPEDIAEIARIAELFEPKSTKDSAFPHAIPIPQRAVSPREAFFRDKFDLPLSESAGKTAGENIFIYPPGVPIIVLGEKIDKNSLEYLRKIRYNIDKEISVF